MAEHQPEAYGFGTEIPVRIEEAIERTTAALKQEGFGVLTTIDVRATMREKLGVEFEPYVILGACNPQLAHRALLADHAIGLLLPCNVIVHQHGDASVVDVVDPRKMMGVAAGNRALAAVAEEAEARLRRVVAALSGSATEALPGD